MSSGEDIIVPGGTPTPAGDQAAPLGIPHREFLERALAAAGEWTRFTDPKALGVLVLLGLGAKDLLDHAARFVHPHERATDRCGLASSAGHSCQGVGATALFVLACLLAAVVVFFVTRALFPRITLKGLLGEETRSGLPTSRFFFAEVGRYGSQEAYAQAVLATKPHELLRDVAGQVWEISRVCTLKQRAVRHAYGWALIFLIVWALSRVLLAGVR
jgi:hypothetical protein